MELLQRPVSGHGNETRLADSILAFNRGMSVKRLDRTAKLPNLDFATHEQLIPLLRRRDGINTVGVVSES